MFYYKLELLIMKIKSESWVPIPDLHWHDGNHNSGDGEKTSWGPGW